jgi:hypothetical protein
MANPTLQIGVEPGASSFPDPWPVFDALRPEAEELTWVMWGWMDATAKMGTDVHVGELDDRVHSSPFGLPISWESLADLLDDLIQVIDGNFVGCSDPSRVPRFPDTDLRTLHRSQEFAVTAFDSTFWWVTAPPSVTERLQHVFPHAELGEPPVGAHGYPGPG